MNRPRDRKMPMAGLARRFWRAYYQHAARRSKADVAFVFSYNRIYWPFIHALRRHRGLEIDIVSDGGFSKYRHVIIPSGRGLGGMADRIAPEKRIYLETGFFPQSRSVYLDRKGIHARSAFRDKRLEPLSADDRRRVEAFRAHYTRKNFVKSSRDENVFFDHPVVDGRVPDFIADRPFLFIPLQLESDTAFRHQPFESNRSFIAFVQQAFPDRRLVFKTHPMDPTVYDGVRSPNVLLPRDNTDLRLLLTHACGVIALNSTVLLESLWHRKPCAALGEGIFSDHHVMLECHDKPERVIEILQWRPDWDRVDRFLHHLLEYQVDVDFWRTPGGRARLERRLNELGIVR